MAQAVHHGRSTSPSAPFYKWFDDGELNVSYNCLDRNLANGNADKVAIIFEADDGAVTKVTYRELYHRVCRLANGLKSLGIRKGDRVLVYMPMSIEGVVAMQACARIGATHSVVFGGFSAKSLQERIIDAGAVAVITADEQARGGKHLPLKAIVDEALGMGGCEGIRNVIVYRRTGGNVAFDAPRDLWLHELVGEAGRHLRAGMGRRRASAVHPLHVGLDRQAQGCAAQLGRLPAVGDPDDALDVRHQADGHLLVHRRHRLGDRAHLHRVRPARGRRDRGRVRGRPDVSRRGPLLADDRQAQGLDLLHGADGDPLAGQGLGRDAVDRADEVRPVEPAPARHRRRADQSGSVDVVPRERRRRPLPDRRHVVADGDRRPHDHAAAGRDADGSGLVHAAAARHHGGDRRRDGPRRRERPRRHPRHQAAVAGDDPHDLGRSRALQEVVLPGGARRQALSRRRRRGARQDDGYFTIMGRIDDVLNVSGHRLGTMEIESALVANPMVAEAAVVGRPDDMTGEAVCAFVVLKQARPTGAEAEKIAKELRDWVGKEIGPIAKPKDIRFGDNLPKTRSGKIMRRLLRSIAKGEEITQDVSTLENPAILEQLKQAI